MFSIDANVVVRYLTQDHRELSAKSNVIIEGVEDGRLRVFCDPITLGEIVFVLASRYRLGRAEIAEAVQTIAGMDGFIVPDKARYLHALRLYGTTVPHFGDACACAAAIENCEGRLLSFDRALSGVEGVLREEGP